MCRYKRLAYTDFNEITEKRGIPPHLKEELRKHFTEIVMLPGFGFFALSAMLSIILCGVTRSGYYILMCSILFTLMFLSLLQVGYALHFGQFKVEEFVLTDHLYITDFLLGIDFRNNPEYTSSLQVIKFQSRMYILFVFYAFFVFGVSVGIASDKFSPPTGSSSCTRDASATSNTYNPNGYFDHNLQFRLGIPLKMFPMDQSWANPVLADLVIGYSTSPLESGVANPCSTVLPQNRDIPRTVNGFVDTDVCEGSYPSPVLGVAPQMTDTTYGAPILLCAGNNGQTMCINPNTGHAFLPPTVSGTEQCGGTYRIGLPYKICPSCLNAWRWWTGDHDGPLGYDHCDEYNGQIMVSPICIMFSPRIGINEHMLYDDASIIVGVVFTSIQLLAWLFYFAINIFLQLTSSAQNLKVKFV